MSFRLILNLRTVAWVLVAIIASWTLPRGWHDLGSAILVAFAFIDRNLCIIAHAMESKTAYHRDQRDAATVIAERRRMKPRAVTVPGEAGERVRVEL